MRESGKAGHLVTAWRFKRQWLSLLAGLTILFIQPQVVLATGFAATTGSMDSIRQYHTATVLDDGRVLIAGGQGVNGTTLNTAQIYDPATGTFGATGGMVAARQQHTATKLTNGKILIAGGFSGSSYLSSCEIFDPAGNGGAGTFTATASMNAARSQHAAVRISGNRVLVAGGTNDSVLGSAEIFDPAANSGIGGFTVTNSMVTARRLHTATLLNDGHVLIAGGSTNASVTNTAEIYFPAADASGSFSQVTNVMTSPRREHTATLLKNGMVLLAGGYYNYNYLASAEIFDPGTGAAGAGTFTATTSAMAIGHGDHAAVLLTNGNVLITGGNTGSIMGTYGPTPSAEIFGTAANTFSSAGSMVVARANHAAVTLSDGSVLVAGGYNVPSDTFWNQKTAEIYTSSSIKADPAQVQFSPTIVGNSSSPQSFTIGNRGLAGLSIGSIALSGTDQGMFSVLAGSDCYPLPHSLPTYLDTCTLTVMFTPTSSGNKTASLELGSNDPAMPTLSIPLTGTGVVPEPDLVITNTHSGNFRQWDTGQTYTITVTNNGSGPTNGQVTVSDTLPTGLTATAISGTGWTCNTPTSCTRSDVLAAGTSYPAITLTVNVAGNAAASVTNTVTVSGGGESNQANDTANDITAITQVPDLTITKTHSGNFTQWDTGKIYTITVTNAGSGPTSGLVTVTDTLPTGLTASAISGTGWTCSTLTSCTRSDVLATNSSYPPITLTVSVAGNAPTAVINSVTVSGGGEVVTSNDVANDPTTITTPTPYALSLTIAGNGAGSVSVNSNRESSPLHTCGSSCTTDVSSGSVVTLHVESLDQYSLFKGWSGACTSASGDCVFTMTSAKSATAEFDINFADSVLIEVPSPVYYSSIGDAYKAAPNDSSILMWGVNFSENLVFDLGKTVKLDGGYNSGYSGYSGVTTVSGNVVVTSGQVVMEKVVIK